MISRLTRLAIQMPRCVIALALALAFVSIALTVKRLEFKTNRADLLNPDTAFQQRWIDYEREFDAADDVLVVVSADSPVPIQRAIDQLGVELRKHSRLFRNVHDRFDQEQLVRKGLFYLEPQDLAKIRQHVDQLVPLLETTTDPLHWNSLASESNTDPIGWQDLLLTAMSNPDAYTSPWPFKEIEDNLRQRLPKYSLIDEDKLGVVSLQLAPSSDGFVQGTTSIRELRQIVQQVTASHPRVELGVTGLPVIEHDEMATSQQDMTYASILTLGAVSFLFFLGFGNLRYPISAIAALVLGLTWTCGYLTLSVGHLNILSMAFGVILIGLGIDFAIHYVARYSAFRESGMDTETALQRTAATVGPAIAVGGVTTSSAFFATGATEFLGVAELGMIAGGGILLCVLSTLVVLPALLRIQHDRPADGRSPSDFWIGTLEAAWSRPRATLVWGLCITLLLALGLPRLNYDHNLLNLQAHGLDSVAWEQRLIDRSDRSIWYAVSLAHSREALDARRKAFLNLPSVRRVDDLSELLPTTSVQQRRAVEQIHDRLSQLSELAPTLTPIQADQLPPELMTLAQQTLDGPANLSVWLRRMNLVRTVIATDLWEQLQSLKRIADPNPPQLSDLPTAIQARFRGRSGSRLMRVYAQGNSWETEALREFVLDVKSVDPLATGAPLQTYYASQQMQRSYLDAAVYAAFAVFAILWWNLRRLSLVALAAVPTLFGLTQLFGLMGLLDIPLNPANVIVLPLILGIGVDDGIHVIHDLRCRKRLRAATTHGIVMTSLTSMIGFGSLMLAQHEGLRSLGRVVTLGITCCLLSSLVWLPCLVATLAKLGKPIRKRTTRSATGGPARSAPDHRRAATPRFLPRH